MDTFIKYHCQIIYSELKLVHKIMFKLARYEKYIENPYEVRKHNFPIMKLLCKLKYIEFVLDKVYL